MGPRAFSRMTLDTNILIAYLAGDAKVVEALSEWRRDGKALLLPTVVESELLSFTGWTSDERHATEEFLEQNFTSIPFDRTTARIAAEIRRASKFKFPDAAIAATALSTRTPLVTRNEHDFRRIPNLRIVTL
jgi:tRNA(fMet)-specific endonuclease VapC